MTVQEWRDRHRRCAWCVHAKSNEVYDDDYTDLYITICTCTAKNKRVDPTTPRPFCRLFEQKIEHVLIDETEADIVSKFSPAARELYYKIVYPERED